MNKFFQICMVPAGVAGVTVASSKASSEKMGAKKALVSAIGAAAVGSVAGQVRTFDYCRRFENPPGVPVQECRDKCSYFPDYKLDDGNDNIQLRDWDGDDYDSAVSNFGDKGVNFMLPNLADNSADFQGKSFKTMLIDGNLPDWTPFGADQVINKVTTKADPANKTPFGFLEAEKVLRCVGYFTDNPVGMPFLPGGSTEDPRYDSSPANDGREWRLFGCDDGGYADCQDDDDREPEFTCGGFNQEEWQEEADKNGWREARDYWDQSIFAGYDSVNGQSFGAAAWDRFEALNQMTRPNFQGGYGTATDQPSVVLADIFKNRFLANDPFDTCMQDRNCGIVWRSSQTQGAAECKPLKSYCAQFNNAENTNAVLQCPNDILPDQEGSYDNNRLPSNELLTTIGGAIFREYDGIVTFNREGPKCEVIGGECTVNRDFQACESLGVPTEGEGVVNLCAQVYPRAVQHSSAWDPSNLDTFSQNYLIRGGADIKWNPRGCWSVATDAPEKDIPAGRNGHPDEPYVTPRCQLPVGHPDRWD